MVEHHNVPASGARDGDVYDELQLVPDFSIHSLQTTAEKLAGRTAYGPLLLVLGLDHLLPPPPPPK